MKKVLSIVLSLVLVMGALVCLSACGNEKKAVTIAVPNDGTNEGRALMLLEDLGLITLNEEAGVTATKNDIKENPYNIDIKEVEAANVPNMLKDVSFAIINGNYALDAGLSPATDALETEKHDSYSKYSNLIAVKEGNEETDATKALVAAVSSKQVADFITEKYSGSVVADIANQTDGYDESVDYEALKGKTITIGASATPHAEILEEVKKILAEKEITLDIKIFADYIQPNMAVESGELDANYFQHLPYLEDFNESNGTHIVNVLLVHAEPMGIYAGQLSDLAEIKG